MGFKPPLPPEFGGKGYLTFGGHGSRILALYAWILTCKPMSLSYMLLEVRMHRVALALWIFPFRLFLQLEQLCDGVERRERFDVERLELFDHRIGGAEERHLE